MASDVTVPNPPPDPPETVHMEADDYASKKLNAGDLLWHYARDFNGLNGILKGELWASSLPYLNDTQEFRYGVHAILDALGMLLESGEHARAILSFLEENLVVRYKPHDLFSISFSTQEDDLSQWRAYSGVNGPSFSVGFDPKELEFHANGYLFELHEVKYEASLVAADVKQELQQQIDDLNATIRAQKSASVPIEFARNQAAALTGPILQMAPRYKHPKFSAEKEWRLIRWQPVIARTPRLPRRYRLSGSLVVPYIAMPLHTPLSEAAVYGGAKHASSPMRAITIGPSVHSDELKYAIEDMTARSGLALIEVKPSAVPFRNW